MKCRMICLSVVIALRAACLAGRAPSQTRQAALIIAQKNQKTGDQVDVEHAGPLPRTGLLGTGDYQASDAEKKFLAHWPKADEATNADSLMAKDLSGRVGKAVGWFGIVRKVTEDKEQKQTRLLLEMKYFDGLCDLDIQVVSIYGGGDFVAVFPGVGHSIKELNLKASTYGMVVKEETKDGRTIPQVNASYVRDWHWGLFNFMDYGDDNSNPEWKPLRKVKGEEVYSP